MFCYFSLLFSFRNKRRCQLLSGRVWKNATWLRYRITVCHGGYFVYTKNSVSVLSMLRNEVTFDLQCWHLSTVAKPTVVNTGYIIGSATFPLVSSLFADYLQLSHDVVVVALYTNCLFQPKKLIWLKHCDLNYLSHHSRISIVHQNHHDACSLQRCVRRLYVYPTVWLVHR